MIRNNRRRDPLAGVGRLLAIAASSPYGIHIPTRSRRRRRLLQLTVALVLVGSTLTYFKRSDAGAPANNRLAGAPALIPPAAPTPTQPAPTQPPTPADPPAPVRQKAPALSDPPAVKAASAILMDAVSGQILYERNADAQRPMASTTKIMTALLFCENVKDEDVITASDYAAQTKGSSLHLKKGEKIAGGDLLHAILMRSANDACVAAAERIAGTEAAFVEKMNARAAELGATHTHFANPHGLNDPAHYTTARDLATIARAALQEPRIREIVKTKHCVICRPSGSPDTSLRNHDWKFLERFPGADGVKTGWTVPAGHCYVGSATIRGWKLISVVLKSPDYVHETALLMKYGFNRFAPRLVAQPGEAAGECPVAKGVAGSVPATVKSPLQVVLPIPATAQVEKRYVRNPLAAPIAAGATVGAIEAWADGQKLAEVPLIAAKDDALLAAATPKPNDSRHSGVALVAFLGAGLVSIKYGTRLAAFTKSARRRRSRFPSSL